MVIPDAIAILSKSPTINGTTPAINNPVIVTGFPLFIMKLYNPSKPGMYITTKLTLI